MHADYQPGSADPMAPSAIPISKDFQVFSPKTYQMCEYPTPRAMTKEDIKTVIQQFA